MRTLYNTSKGTVTEQTYCNITGFIDLSKSMTIDKLWMDKKTVKILNKQFKQYSKILKTRNDALLNIKSKEPNIRWLSECIIKGYWEYNSFDTEKEITTIHRVNILEEWNELNK